MMTTDEWLLIAPDMDDIGYGWRREQLLELADMAGDEDPGRPL